MIDRRRLAMVLGMLGSAHDGEIVAAARQAERLRRGAGVTWHEVLDVAAGDDDPVADLIDNIVAQMDRLTEWEKKFMRSIAGWSPERVTPKQKAVLDRIARRLRAARAA